MTRTRALVSRQRRDRPGSERKPCRKIIAVAGEQPHAGTIASRHYAEAIVLDFVNPIRAGRWSLGRGRQARFDKADRTTVTHTQHVDLIGSEA
jgi:hypothetical protein